MRTLTAFLCLTFAVLLFSAGVSWSADFQKGITAYDSEDYATALREWTPLAKQGYADAQNALVFLYGNGKGVLQDYIRAYMWWNIAASSGDSKSASKNSDIVAKRMNSNQIETAQKLAQECIAKNTFTGN